MKFVDLPENNYTGFIACYELDGYYIDVFHTVFKSYRIAIREIDSLSYLTNWCVGPKDEHKNLLLKVAEHIISADILDDAPAYNEPKPFYNDIKFIEWLNSLGFEI